jgi:hypothetical protein
MSWRYTHGVGALGYLSFAALQLRIAQRQARALPELADRFSPRLARMARGEVRAELNCAARHLVVAIALLRIGSVGKASELIWVEATDAR